MKFNLKRLLFDAGYFTYFTLTVIYLALDLLPTGAALAPTQDNATAHMAALAQLTALIFALSLGLSALLEKFKIATLGAVLFHRTPSPPRALHSFWGLHLLLTLVLTFLVSLQMTSFSLTELTDREGVNGALRLFRGLTHANLALLPTAIVQVIETIYIAFLATVIAVPFAFLLGFLSAKNVMTHPAAFVIYAAIRTLLNIVRSVEPLIWALVFTVWVGVGPFAGMLALMFHTLASLAKQYSELNEDISEGPMDAIKSTGANAVQVVWFGMVPQVMLQYIAFTIYRWDTNVRMATVIGLVGGGGVGTLLIKYQGQAMWPEVGCIILVIALAVWLMDVASAYIREALR